MQLADLFKGEIVDVGKNHATIQLVSWPTRLVATCATRMRRGEDDADAAPLPGVAPDTHDAFGCPDGLRFPYTPPGSIEAFIEIAKPYGIVETARSGVVAMPRGIVRTASSWLWCRRRCLLTHGWPPPLPIPVPPTGCPAIDGRHGRRRRHVAASPLVTLAAATINKRGAPGMHLAGCHPDALFAF